ncbi:MAG: signal peptidase I [Nitrososphaerales archaeon]|nr:signal peptidase I [Nitrososphaerales archaeon]
MAEGDSQSIKIDKKKLLKATAYIFIVLAIISAVWLVPRVALGTSTPFFSVSSGSMIPTLNVGDYIVVKAESFNNLNVSDIIVFYSPWDPDEIIVHRIYAINHEQEIIRTKGDNNDYVDPWSVTKEDYIGKYTGFKIPYLGYLAFLFPPPVNYIFIIIILLIVFVIELLPAEKEKVEALPTVIVNIRRRFVRHKDSSPLIL